MNHPEHRSESGDSHFPASPGKFLSRSGSKFSGCLGLPTRVRVSRVPRWCAPGSLQRAPATRARSRRHDGHRQDYGVRGGYAAVGVAGRESPGRLHEQPGQNLRVSAKGKAATLIEHGATSTAAPSARLSSPGSTPTPGKSPREWRGTTPGSTSRPGWPEPRPMPGPPGGGS